MTERIPLGEREDLRREFKGRDALKKLETIAREVVAMLNADGGTVWVGLRDEGDRAVAVEPIPDAARERRRLRDYLVDTIEPSPAGEEVGVEAVPAEEGEILKIDVRPRKERAPYAHLKEGGRFFLIRVEDRTRPMARNEIFSQEERRSERSVQKAEERLLREREELLRSGDKLLWLGVQPVRDLQLDLEDALLNEILRDPVISGNRRTGCHFAWSGSRPVLRKERLVSNREGQASVEIQQSGGLRFEIRLEALYWPDRGDLWPMAIMEYPIAAFRMARTIFRSRLDSEDVVLADLALIGARGTRLRSGSQATHFYGSMPSEFNEADDLVWGQPLRFMAKEITETPDLCGFRMVERIYQAFGLPRGNMPPEFDQKAGRLILPE